MYEEVKKTNRAGLVPYVIEDGEIWMLFMKPNEEIAQWSGDYFQIAKGKVEDDETFEQCAIREAQEELGLFRGNIVAVEEVGIFMGRTTMFIAKMRDKDMFGLPADDETSDTMWMTEEMFLQQGRPLHHHVVGACVRAIRRLEESV